MFKADKAKNDQEPAHKQRAGDKDPRVDDSRAMSELKLLVARGANAREVAQLVSRNYRDREAMISYLHEAKGMAFTSEVQKDLRRLRNKVVGGEHSWEDDKLDDDQVPPDDDDGTVSDDDGTVSDDEGIVSADDGLVSSDDGLVADKDTDDGTVDTKPAKKQTR